MYYNDMYYIVLLNVSVMNKWWEWRKILILRFRQSCCYHTVKLRNHALLTIVVTKQVVVHLKSFNYWQVAAWDTEHQNVRLLSLVIWWELLTTQWLLFHIDRNDVKNDVILCNLAKLINETFTDLSYMILSN